METFQNLHLSFVALKNGGNSPCVLNAANEVAVARFLKDDIGFLEMSDLVASAMEKVAFIEQPSLEDLLESDAAARSIGAQY